MRQLEQICFDDLMPDEKVVVVNERDEPEVKLLKGWDEESGELIFEDGSSLYVYDDRIFCIR